MRKAFTLTEVLITLAIVGLVAVLTIPNIMEGAFNRANIAKRDATYTQIQDALKNALLDEEVRYLSDTKYLTSATPEKFFIDENLQVLENCSSISNCFASSYNNESGSAMQSNDIYSGATVGAILKNNVVLAIKLPTSDTTDGRIILDVNGKEAPNVLNKDLFLIKISPNGEISSL